ncbi:hypothetical protein [Streptomyces sp. NPDC056983]
MNRRRVRVPRIYGWGQLMVAFALRRQTAFGFSASGTRASGH